MCQLACRSLVFVMVDPWEAKQSTYQRTLTVLCRVKNYLCENTLVPAGNNEFDDIDDSFRNLRLIINYSSLSTKLTLFLLFPGSLKVMLVCGSDLLESFRKSFWIPEQVHLYRKEARKLANVEAVNTYDHVSAVLTALYPLVVQSNCCSLIVPPRVNANKNIIKYCPIM
ncbi:uncharacterized protein LOC141638465 [Silene latifolia]|uniref:uncharacterized protein LOC141638465 n=1 Tax=Silene latifolia TaxID=37657 RepID=UPI003D77B0CA